MDFGLRMKAPTELEIVPLKISDEPADNEVLLKVKVAGICGSDLHIYDGTHPIGDYPKILGHEFAGEVEKVGKSVTNVKKGDAVVVDPIVSCGECYSCIKLNKPNICSNLKVRGVHLDGGFSTRIVLPSSSVFPVKNLSWKAAAMVEPFSVGAQILDKTRLVSGEVMLINGVGAIGQATLMLAKYYGAIIIAADVCDSHLEQAKKLGADLTINVSTQDLYEEVNAFTNNEGIAVLLDSVGNASTFDKILPCAAPGARIIVIGFDKNAIRISPFDITFNEFQIIGSRLNTHKFKSIIDLFESGKIHPEQIISHVFNYKEALKVFPFIFSHPSEVNKVVLEF